jgi:NADH:ubiquinone oxidoreductase subunit C
MNKDELKQLITAHTPDAVFEEGGEFLNVITEGEKFFPLIKFLRESPQAGFDYLFCETAVDWNTHFFVVYHLTSKKHKHTLVIKNKITGRENPETESVYSLWKTAEFHEREIYDLFGIKFKGHPNLKRIFLDDEIWKGHPLRKDYNDKTNIVEL